MTTDRPPSVPRREALTVYVNPGHGSEGAAPALELRGTVDPGRIEAAVHRALTADPGAPAWRYRLRRHGPAHHTLTLDAPEAADTRGHFPAGLLADLLTALPETGPPAGSPPAGSPPGVGTGPAAYAEPVPRPGGTADRRPPHRTPAPAGAAARYGPVTSVLRAGPLQSELLADADARPGTATGVAQLTWEWHGPLDLEPFAAAWQSVYDRESVLRAGFDDADPPRVAVRQWVVPELLRVRPGAADWTDVVARDRARGLDPRRPGPVRVTVLESPAAPAAAPGGGPPHRMLLTYHHALLDDTSARLLLRGFFRAYLAGGRLPGGDRHPDIGDYSDWLAAQDLTPAREFWSLAAPPAGAAGFPVPAPPGTAAPRTGTVRARHRLSPGEAAELSAWAGRWGATDFCALQAAWALLHHSTGEGAAVPVAFSVPVSGRGIPFDTVDRMPGALRNPLPVSVVVDPRTPVPGLLTQLRDRALDMAAYEWVSAGQIESWTDTNRRARPPYPGRAGTLLEFTGGPRPSAVPADDLAAQGIRVSEPVTHDADTAFPLVLSAHHDAAGGLVLGVAYDPSRLPDADGVLARVAEVLRQLPRRGDQYTTVGAFLDALAAEGRPPRTPAPRASARAHPGHDTGPLLRTLRPAAGPGQALVCLVPAPGMSPARHEQLAPHYPGPEALVLLSDARRPAEARLAALAPLLGPGRRLVLGGFSGAGGAAYEIARLAARAGGGPALVVLAAAATPPDVLARALAAAAAPAG
ncbi:condensation domain-containing protein [Streptomyces sp. NPDC059876]|uniref:condensation domain-containing protein n=2 Tax=Streptomyces TaxID=1883 RepID=UPI003666C582